MKKGCLVSLKWAEKIILVAFLWTLSLWSAWGGQETNTVFNFKLPQQSAFIVATPSTQLKASLSSSPWLAALPANGDTNRVELGSKVVLQVENGIDIKALLFGRPLKVESQVKPNVFLLQATDAWVAAQQSAILAGTVGVKACYPVMRRQIDPDSLYAQRSNDAFAWPYFIFGSRIDALWFLENRDSDGSELGLDLNVMSAWPYTRGEGVTVAVADSGLEMTHPELANQISGAPHMNFDQPTNAASPLGDGDMWTHGTSVAGLIAAEGNNQIGMIGVAPLAKLASWLIYTTNAMLVSDDLLMKMYQHGSNSVAIQNHSWGAGNGRRTQRGPTLLEKIGIENAVTLGRDGLGTVIVRSAGNDRTLPARADDDGYSDDPSVIAIAAVLKTGRVTSYSEPGACILVAAPGGGAAGSQGLLTLDLKGPNRGVHRIGYYSPIVWSDYRFGQSDGSTAGFAGTSASAPLISGITALVLSANPALGYRDVQQILLLSSRQWDLADPDLCTNGAAFLVSHNTGFGVPNAGEAVRLAKLWKNRPPLTELALTNSIPMAIPDNGLRVIISGDQIPENLRSIHCLPSASPHPDAPTAALPLVDVGLATSIPSVNLTNRAALILRGSVNFDVKITNSAAAGAAFAIVYNNSSTNDGLMAMANTDFVSIPAVFISNADGQSLKALFQTNSSARAQLSLAGTNCTFDVKSNLLCEHVGVRIQTDHPLRGDVRLTLVSPQGTRSILQVYNSDTNSGPADWTYWSTHHFFESSVGNWTVYVSDESAGFSGTVRSVSLIVRGVPISDSDHDGLDDNWETTKFGTLAYGAKEDPDQDGFNNAREQVMNTEPLKADLPFRVELCSWNLWNSHLMRVNWPSTFGKTYQVWSGTSLSQPLTLITNLPGGFPETVWFGSMTNSQRFYKVVQQP